MTQSGETADTLVGIRQAREHGAPVIAITNVVARAITRLADAVLYLQAGPEIGVVATKTFLTSVTILYLLGLYLGELRKQMTQAQVFSTIQYGPTGPILDNRKGVHPHF